MKIKINIDRKAVIAATGEDRGLCAEIEITKEQMGEHWPALVAGLNDDTPPVLTAVTDIPGLDAAAICAAFDVMKVEKDARRLRERAELDRWARELDAADVASRQPITTTPRMVYIGTSYWGGDLTRKDVGLVSDGSTRDGAVPVNWPSRPIPEINGTHSVLPEFSDEVEANDRRRSEISNRNDAEISAAREAAVQLVVPQLLAAREANRLANEKTTAELEAARQARITDEAARRLETGHWERETPSYNQRKYSAPWCAKVSFPSGAKALYEFGDSTGKWGAAGLLRIACAPGEIIAYGQKDMRRPGNSDHTILVMLANGCMKGLDKTEAFRLWTAAAALKKQPITDTGAGAA